MKIHDDKKFICDGCGKAFSCKVRLAAHFRKAHLSAALFCSICGKAYKMYQTPLLKTHMLDHQNIRPYPCEICSKSFKSIAIKTEHIRAVHFKSKIKCELCGRSFPRPGKYRDHAKAKHTDLGTKRLEEWVARIAKIRPDYDKMEWAFL